MPCKSLLSRVLLIPLFWISACLAQPADFFIQDGDVVLIWGNSITDYGVYPRMIENYVLTHYPDWQVEFFNLGWGGDRTVNVGRLKRDIQLCKPTKATIMLGMNDGRYRPFDPENLEVYLKGMEDEIEVMRKHSNPEIMLISATPFELRCTPQYTLGTVDDLKRMGLLLYPETLRRFSFELGKFAARRGLPFVDLNFSSSRLLEELASYDGNFMFTAEGVHPNVDGQLQMGLAILEGMQAPTLVAECIIDAARGTVLEQKDCQISALKASSREVSFTRKAKRLPLPIYPSTRALIKHVMNYPENWDRDLVTVKGLAPGWYELSIDGRAIDVLSAAELEEGVNLSRYGHTPQMIQAYQVFEQTEIRQQAFYNKWRKVLLEGVGSPRDFTPFKEGVSTDSLDRVERAAFAAQHRLNKPKAHRFEIKPVAHPAGKPKGFIPAGEFLENMVKVVISIDSRTLPCFEPPLVVRGNFTYAPQYEWAILERKGYYADLPVALYDDGSHGDKKAGDGIYSIEMFLRKDSGELRFALYDGRFLHTYWNRLRRDYFVNPYCSELTRAWGEMLGAYEDGEITGIKLKGDLRLEWNMKAFEKALQQKKIYQP